MKILHEWKKELQISSRGFYFYVELVVTVIILLIMLFLVPDEAGNKKEEFLFYNMKPELSQRIIEEAINNGTMEKTEDKTFHLQPNKITLFPDRLTVPDQYEELVYPRFDEENTIQKTTNDDGSFSFAFDDEKEVIGKGYVVYDGKGGTIDKHVYLLDSFEDVLRLSSQERRTGGVIYYDKDFREHYEIFFPRPVTEKLKNATYALHNDNIYDVIEEAELQNIRYLGNVSPLNYKQSFVPLIIVYLNALMGIVIVASYVFHDKKEHLLQLTRVSPLSMRNLLIAKLLAFLPVSLLSSLLVCIPMMKTEANYLLLVPLILSSSFFAGSIGLLISSFFCDMKSSFGVVMIVMIIFMLPILSYYIPTFSPSWVQFIPSHYILLSVKDLVSSGTNNLYAIMTTFFLLIGSIPLIEFAALRLRQER